MPRKRRCPVCGARGWHKEAASGLVMCSEGHVLQDYRNETTEKTELGAHALKKRTMRSVRDGEEMVHSRADGQLYYGARARYHYFECLQWLLRIQVAVLVKEWGLPGEFEMVCRDVWALHLSVLPRPPEPEPWIYAQNKGESNANQDDKSDSDGDSDGSSISDLLLDDLLREASQSDGSELPESRAREAVRISQAWRRYEKPVGNMAVLMLACWMMRVPVMYADMIRLIETYRLPYLEGVQQLPPEMRRHLARETVSMLSPRFAPRVITVHRLTGRLARLLRSQYGIETPERNAAPILWRTVRALKGTSTMYGLSKKMARTLRIPLTVEGTRVPSEVELAGAVIVVLKLLFGLDGRSTDSDLPGNDPAGAVPCVTDYLSTTDVGDTCVTEDPLDVAEMMIGDDVESIIRVYFPFGQGQQQQQQQQQQYRPPPPAVGVTHGHTRLPASSVPIFASVDVLGQLPAPYTVILDAAAHFLRIDSEIIAAVVETSERRLVRLSH